MNIHRKDWCWSWNFNTLATWCKEPTHWKRRWCWETLKSGEGEDRGRDSWMTSPTWWTWVEQTPGVGDGQESLVCCSPWGCKELDTTEQLNWTELLEKCKSKLQWDINPQQSEWWSSKSLPTVNPGEGLERREPFYTVSRNVNCDSHCGEEYGDSFKN